MSQPNLSGMDALLRPRSVAVVGTPTDTATSGCRILQNLVDYGFPGPVLAIGLDASEIAGCQAHASLTDVSQPPELALIAAPAASVPDIAEQAANVGVKAVVVMSAGFGEAGEEGRRAQSRLAELGQRSGLRILGPNSAGVCNVARHLNGTRFRDVPHGEEGISFASQSGAYGQMLLDECQARGIGLGTFVGLGNQLDVSFTDIVAWLAQDPATAVIALFVEAIQDGPGFMEAVRTARKPVLVLKAGRRHAGSRAAAAHTSATAGEREVYTAALRQAGAILAPDTESLFDMAVALAAHGSSSLPAGKRVAIVTTSAGPAVVASDTCEELGLEVPVLAPETQGRIRQLIPEVGAAGNPVDLAGEADPDRIAACLNAISHDPSVDGLVFITIGQDLPEYGAAAFKAAERLPATACVRPAPAPVAPLWGTVPAFATPERAVRAYKSLHDYGRVQRALSLHLPATPGEHVSPMTIEGSGVMDEHEAKRLLDRWGIPVVPETLVTGPGRHEFTPIRKLATHFGFPVVLKAIHRDIIHKTELGAVAVGIPDIDRLKVAWEDMHTRFPDAAWLIQPFLPGDVEVTVIARRDPVFGPVVVFGTGGVMTELYHDVALRVAPLSHADALEMIEETKAAELMHGFRGLPLHDPREVADIIVRTGQLMLGQPSVLELEINPVLLTEKGPIAVGAMAVIR